MATLSSISLRFVSLFALVVALASSGSALPSASFHGGGGSVSVLDACGGVTIMCGSFYGSFALFLWRGCTYDRQGWFSPLLWFLFG